MEQFYSRICSNALQKNKKYITHIRFIHITYQYKLALLAFLAFLDRWDITFGKAPSYALTDACHFIVKLCFFCWFGWNVERTGLYDRESVGSCHCWSLCWSLCYLLQLVVALLFFENILSIFYFPRKYLGHIYALITI